MAAYKISAWMNPPDWQSATDDFSKASIDSIQSKEWHCLAISILTPHFDPNPCSYDSPQPIVHGKYHKERPFNLRRVKIQNGAAVHMGVFCQPLHCSQSHNERLPKK
jgi:hypothetical protein